MKARPLLQAVWIAIATAESHEGIQPVVVVARTRAQAEKKRKAEIERLAALPYDSTEICVPEDMWVDFEEIRREL